MYGIYITRMVPKKLTALRSEVIFEQIPVRRRELVARTRQLVVDSAQATDVIAKFYTNHLAAYMETSRSIRYLLIPSSRYCKKLVAETRGLDRYLSIEQRAFSGQLIDMIQMKEDLDFHYAMQGRLKIWLFAHIE